MRSSLAFLFVFLSLIAHGQYNSARELVHDMYLDIREEPLEAFTFKQETIRYRGDTLTGDTSIWYEVIQYPDKFRIDFGHPEAGNAVIYKSDSAFVFREGILQTARYEPMPLLFLEGGMLFYPFDEVMSRLQSLGLDTAVFNQQEWQGNSYWVLGAEPGDLQSRQVWVDTKTLMPVRRIDPHRSGKSIELVYKNFKEFEGHWIETRVDIFIDGNFIQKEFYHDIDPDPKIPEGLFDPEKFGMVHWKKD
jgi:hypothetical protein